jgi:hypothetical protein
MAIATSSSMSVKPCLLERRFSVIFVFLASINKYLLANLATCESEHVSYGIS